MTADKRTVTTDALETLGTIIGTAEGRDAIHLAVEPIEAAEVIGRGMPVKIHEGKAWNTGALDSANCVGIVDPFLNTHCVKPGQRFWLVVLPRTITSLRHVWTHPAFPAAEVGAAPVAHDKATSEAWLRNFITVADCPDYETVIAAALNNRSWSKEYLHFDGEDAHGEIPPEFWTHVEIVTGRQIAPEDRAEYFSCSC